jgi:hypothetical protein
MIAVECLLFLWFSVTLKVLMMFIVGNSHNFINFTKQIGRKFNTSTFSSFDIAWIYLFISIACSVDLTLSGVV